MQSLAVLLTCFNRKPKTLACLKQLYLAHENCEQDVQITVYLTDDGSTDGTAEAVKQSYPDVIVLKGNGELFWAGGMRNSWNAACNNKHDAYLLLNDDTNVNSDFIQVLLETRKYCLENYNTEGIYVGSTKDQATGKLSYGGAKLTNTFWFKYHFINPSNTPIPCHLGNANIMWVPNEVVNKIGTLSEGYVHGVADYDYTLMAKKFGIPVLIAPGFLGTCTDDHGSIYDNFHELSIRQRIAKIKSPIGLDLKSNLLLQKKFFPFRVPFVLGSALIKILFPKLYVKRFNIN